MFEKIIKKNKDKMSKVNFIQKNMDTVVVDQEEQQRDKLFKIRSTWNRIESAKYRKDTMELEQRKKKMFMLHRWEFLKDKRNEMYQELIKQKMERYRKHFWVKGVITSQILNHIFTIFDQTREKATRKAKIQFAVNMFAIKFRLWSQRKRKTYDERQI